MMPSARVAAIQMVSGGRLADNLAQAERLIAGAAAAGAELLVLPENFALMGVHERDKLAIAELPGDGPIQAFLADSARRHGVWIVGGTLPMRTADPERVRAACLLYSDRGEPLARYDKLHLFDVEVGQGESYRESATVEPGDTPVVVETPFGGLGLAVCYDLRFPELFRLMAGQGMELLALPAAFTATTGAAHWQVLLRARAIENQCHVIAAAQGGRHPNGRQTHGESMVIGPWGEILTSWGQGEGMAAASLDREGRVEVRQRFPALRHRRF